MLCLTQYLVGCLTRLDSWSLTSLRSALRMMHKIGWVHRAVSPENILVGDDGDFLLGDLQDAKIMDEGEETRVVRLLMVSDDTYLFME